MFTPSVRGNRSPWLEGLDKRLPHPVLQHQTKTDVAIVGGGIAGVMTAYFLLRETDLRVVLLDAGRIAHGATGHSAGQVVATLERPIAELIHAHGEDHVYSALAELEAAWPLLHEIHTTARVSSPLRMCEGHWVLSDVRQVAAELPNIRKYRERNLQPGRLVVSGEIAGTLDPALSHLYEVVPHGKLLATLGVRTERCVAYVSDQRATINAAATCEEVMSFLLATYPARCSVYEHTPVHALLMRDKSVEVRTKAGSLQAAKVVLCTNGYGGILMDDAGQGMVGVAPQHGVRGVIGYMAAFLDPQTRWPAITNFASTRHGTLSSYFYVTRQPFTAANREMDLICIGGPELPLDARAVYRVGLPFTRSARDAISRFVRRTYTTHAEGSPRFAYRWHGVMGYTNSGLRLIGPDARQPRLLYNLGCNGIGILPSIHGGKRIASVLAGRPVRSSIFDPPERINS